jgi:hypothetical protein
MIHVFGDSHVAMFSGVDERALGFPNTRDQLSIFRTYDMGPILAYNFHKRINFFPEWVDKFEIERILFYIGEIDVRMWSVKIAHEQNRSLNGVVLETVLRYIDGVMRVATLVKEVIVFGPHPQRRQPDGILKDFHYGTYDEIYEAGKLFNHHLKESKGVTICSLFPRMMGKEINKQFDYYMDDFHLKATKCLPMIMDTLKEEGVQL